MGASATLTRRAFLCRAAGLAAIAGSVPSLTACGHADSSGPQAEGESRLTARPGEPTTTPARGAAALGLGSPRDGVLYVPARYSPVRPAPLLVLLHGSGGSASEWQSYYERAEQRGLVLLAPNSRYGTWDLLLSHFGPDVAFLDQALAATFARCRIDPARIALAGFSDGASYALSLGASNGDLFSHLIGYSPGTYAPASSRPGRPEVFVAHGTQDTVLSVTRSRGTIVPRMREQGYAVTYHEFDGGHRVPAEVSEAALDWFAGPREID